MKYFYSVYVQKNGPRLHDHCHHEPTNNSEANTQDTSLVESFMILELYEVMTQATRNLARSIGPR